MTVSRELQLRAWKATALRHKKAFRSARRALIVCPFTNKEKEAKLLARIEKHRSEIELATAEIAKLSA